MKLLGSLASPFTRKVRVVLAEKRIECELERVDVQPLDNPVNAHNPLGKIPTLLLDDDTALYDSRVIVEFLDAVSPISRSSCKDLVVGTGHKAGSTEFPSFHCPCSLRKPQVTPESEWASEKRTPCVSGGGGPLPVSQSSQALAWSVLSGMM